MIRARGISDYRRYWGIEMNKVRKMYLGSYSRIEYIDHIIKKFLMKYKFWKYWDSPMIHTMSPALVVAYYMYPEDNKILTSGYYVI